MIQKIVEFRAGDEGQWVARLGNCEITIVVDLNDLKAPADLTINHYNTLPVVPCDDRQCPDGLDPEDIDVCAEKCPFQYDLEQCEDSFSIFGDPILSLIQDFRRYVNEQVDAVGHENEWSEFARMFAERDWDLGGNILLPPQQNSTSQNETTQSASNTNYVNLLAQPRGLDALNYEGVEMYYPDHELAVFGRFYSDIDQLDTELNLQYSPEDAIKAKRFIRHMAGVRVYLRILFAQVEMADPSLENDVIFKYVDDYPADPPEEMLMLNDAVTLLMNRNAFDRERMGLISIR